MLARKLEFRRGLSLVKLELVVARELLKPTDRFVPQWNPCWYPKSTVLVFVLVVGFVNELAPIELLRSSCNVPVRIGSKLGMAAPTPDVDVTKPDVPAPAPPDPDVVPPAPPPVDVLPIPVPVPPGVPCTMPVLTPRVAEPELARRMSVSAMFRL